MKGQRKVGSSTEKANIDKLIRDFDTLPIELKSQIKKQIDDFRQEQSLLNFLPHPLIRNSYKFFWELRNTKSFETPINHQDILAYMTVFDITMEPWEVQNIFIFQNAWYKANEKYKD